MQAVFEERVDPRMPWVGVRLSMTKSEVPQWNYFIDQVSLNLGKVQCVEGCSSPDPIAVTTDGVLIYGLSGDSTIKSTIASANSCLDNLL